MPVFVSFGFIVFLFAFKEIDPALMTAFRPDFFAVFTGIAILLSILGSIRLFYNLQPFYNNISFGVVHKVNVYSMLSGLIFAGFIGSTITKISLPSVGKINKNLFIVISVFEKAVTLGFIVLIGCLPFLVLEKSVLMDVHLSFNGFDISVILISGFIIYFLFFKTYFKEIIKVISVFFFKNCFFSLLIVLLNIIPAYLVINQMMDLNFSDKILYSAILMFAGSLPISFQGVGVRETTAFYLFSRYGIESSVLVGNVLMISFASILAISIMPLTTHFFSETGKEIKEQNETGISKALEYIGENWAVMSIPSVILCLFLTQIFIFNHHIPLTIGDFFALMLLFVLTASFVNKNLDVSLKKMYAVLSGILLFFSLSLSYRWVITGEVSAWALNNRIIGGVILFGYIQSGFLLFSLKKDDVKKTLMLLCGIIFFYSLIYTVSNLGSALTQQAFEISGLKPFYTAGFTISNLHPVTVSISLCFIMIIFLIARHKEIIDDASLNFAGFILSFGIGLTLVFSGILSALIICLMAFIKSRKNLLFAAAVLTGLFFSVLTADFAADQDIRNKIHLENHQVEPGPKDDNKSETGVSQFSVWKKSVLISADLLKQNWLLGAGLGGTLHRFGQEDDAPRLYYNAVSLYLADTGVIGAGLIIGFILWFYSQVRRAQKENSDLKIIFWSGVSCILIFSTMHDVSYQRYVWIWAGIMMFLSGKSDNRYVKG